MPIVNVSYAGSPDERARARLIERVTEAIVQEFSVPAAAVNVLLHSVAPEDWAVAGVPLAVVFRARAGSEGMPPTQRQCRSVWTRTKSLRLHALDYPGRSPAVLIVPGISSPAATWSFVVDALGIPNRVVVLDNRGRGLSDAPSEGYRREDYADDIATWCAELALDRPIVLGHSMGARAAAAFTSRTPGIPLVAVDPPMSGPDRPYPTPLDFYLDGLRSTAAGASIETLRKSSPNWSDARLQDRLTWLPTCTISAITESFEHFQDEAFLDVWSASRGPALMVRGGRSAVVLDGDMEAITGMRPDADVATVAGAGHMVPWDDLAGFIAAVRPWIDRVSADRHTSLPTAAT